MDVQDVTFSVRGMRMSGVLHLPGRKSPPCVVISHGLQSSKDSGKYAELASRLSREGLAVIRFDFLGCGGSEGSLEDTTITGRLEQLGVVMDFVRESGLLSGPIGLMGSSLGGYLSLMKTAEDRDVGAVVTWSAPYRFSEQNPEGGEVPVLGSAFYEDLKNHDLIPVLGSIRHCLIIHGGMDELVPLTHASLIHENVGEPKRLEIIEGADHRFTDSDHRERAYRLTNTWLNAHLTA